MRKIDKIIIHCTATPEGRTVSVDELRLWHKARGFSDVGYHYIIMLDGDLKVGRKLEDIGAHCEGQNHNSIGICYVGGCDSAMTAKDTRTGQQKMMMAMLVADLRIRFPGVTVHGHREFANKDCPSFDVAKEFRKIEK